MKRSKQLVLLIVMVLCVMAMVFMRSSMEDYSLENGRSSIVGWFRPQMRRSIGVERTFSAVDNATGMPLPTLYIVTPTYPRMVQLPELTRLSQTLLLVPNVFWIVADDAGKPTSDVVELLKRIQIPNVYLLSRMPAVHRNRTKGPKPKGVANRRAGIRWIKQNADDNGVLYLADDDNSYDVRLFEEIRYTKKVSMFPVGLVTNLGVSTPIVRESKVVGFYDGWVVNRKFPVDMAGFAVNVGFLKSRVNASMPFVAGYEEDGFLKSLDITMDDIEPLADDCRKILVWHTKTKSVDNPKKISDENKEKYSDTNLPFIPHIT